MSRRNSASRRRSYGRRLHEVNERRHDRRADRLTWLGELDHADEMGGAADPLTYPDWLPDSRHGARP